MIGRFSFSETTFRAIVFETFTFQTNKPNNIYFFYKTTTSRQFLCFCRFYELYKNFNYGFRSTVIVFFAAIHRLPANHKGRQHFFRANRKNGKKFENYRGKTFLPRLPAKGQRDLFDCMLPRSKQKNKTILLIRQD